MRRADARTAGARVARGPRHSALRTLAERVGILPEYLGHDGRRVTTDDARRALLAAMGFDVTTERAARASLRSLDEAESRRVLAPTRVVRASGRTRAGAIALRAPRGAAGPLRAEVDVLDEAGARLRLEGRTRGAALSLGLPALSPGYYRVRATVAAGRREVREEQLLVVAPARCVTPEDKRAGASFGLSANLYSVYRRDGWGVGDLEDLARLVRRAAGIGATFVGINPLHALRIHAGEVSPYGPDSRLFRSELYLDVAAVPELAETPHLRRRLESAGFRAELARARAGDRIDYARVWRLKDGLLRELHRRFVRAHRGRDGARGAAYDRYRAEQGGALDDYATYRALASRHGSDWRRWPAALRDPSSRAVARERDGDEVDYHRFLQFELDRQLGCAARAGELPIGLYQDLAIGSSPAGSDAWSFPGSFARDVHLGAPPDAFQARGQDWGLPPLDPRALARDGYRYWILLLRAAFRHAGALRIDHAMGLARQFWVPADRSPEDGAYVRFPLDDLAGILALESRRAGAVVIAEDLGTVPRGFRAQLDRWAILSSRVLLFERDARGEFRPPERYPRRALATANTHDLPPLRSYWEGHDLELRRSVGAIATDAELAREKQARDAERAALRRLLVAAGGLPRGHRGGGDGRLRGAVHRVLARSRAVLVGVSLDDLSGEREPVNLPGIPPDRFASWSRRMSLPLDRVFTSAEAKRALDGVRSRRRPGRPSSLLKNAPPASVHT